MNNKLFRKIGLDPKRNPAVLDTVTWDAEKMKHSLGRIDEQCWSSVTDAMKCGKEFPLRPDIVFFPDSHSATKKGDYLLAGLEDGQHVLLGTGEPFMEPLYSTEKGGVKLHFFPVDAASFQKYFKGVDSSKQPEALGPVPRLGIGNRMSTSQWPAIFSAMRKGSFSANAIQNSIRELCTLEEILNVQDCETNYLFGFGDITSGHTGNTFEGLWLYGVLEALKNRKGPGYGADADHLKVKPGTSGIEHTKRLIEITHNYTFFTIDLSPVLNYEAFAESDHSVILPDSKSIKEMRLYHQGKLSGNDADKSILDRLLLKYHSALNALEELNNYLRKLKGNESYDLELSIDEIPAGYEVFDQLTEKYEILFLLNECERRGINITHIAPNFGVEKGVDYRGGGGYSKLQNRIEDLHRVVHDRGIVLDCHSGDDLSDDTRRIFKKATEGNLHFKISPRPQEMFAECLYDLQPAVFQNWWDKTILYTKKQAENGSELAKRDLLEFSVKRNGEISPAAKLFLHYGFATVGKRDHQGCFEIREQFYSLPANFYDEYSLRLEKYLCRLSEDLFLI